MSNHGGGHGPSPRTAWAAVIRVAGVILAVGVVDTQAAVAADSAHPKNRMWTARRS